MKRNKILGLKMEQKKYTIKNNIQKKEKLFYSLLSKQTYRIFLFKNSMFNFLHFFVSLPVFTCLILYNDYKFANFLPIFFRCLTRYYISPLKYVESGETFFKYAQRENRSNFLLTPKQFTTIGNYFKYNSFLLITSFFINYLVLILFSFITNFIFNTLIVKSNSTTFNIAKIQTNNFLKNNLFKVLKNFRIKVLVIIILFLEISNTFIYNRMLIFHEHLSYYLSCMACSIINKKAEFVEKNIFRIEQFLPLSSIESKVVEMYKNCVCYYLINTFFKILILVTFFYSFLYYPSTVKIAYEKFTLMFLITSLLIFLADIYFSIYKKFLSKDLEDILITFKLSEALGHHAYFCYTDKFSKFQIFIIQIYEFIVVFNRILLFTFMMNNAYIKNICLMLDDDADSAQIFQNGIDFLEKLGWVTEARQVIYQNLNVKTVFNSFNVFASKPATKQSEEKSPICIYLNTHFIIRKPLLSDSIPLNNLNIMLVFILAVFFSLMYLNIREIKNAREPFLSTTKVEYFDIQQLVRVDKNKQQSFRLGLNNIPGPTTWFSNVHWMVGVRRYIQSMFLYKFDQSKIRDGSEVLILNQ